VPSTLDKAALAREGPNDCFGVRLIVRRMHCAGGTMLKSAACAALIVVLAASAQSRGVLSAAPQATPVLEYNSLGVLFGRNQRWHRSLGGQLEDMQPVPTALSLRGGAEAGKGDPRWIVQDREDGKNVGSWHWEERDMMSWFKQRIEEELVGTPIHMQGAYRLLDRAVQPSRPTGGEPPQPNA